MWRALAVFAVLLGSFNSLVPWCLGGDPIRADVSPRGDRFRPETAKLVGSIEAGPSQVSSFAFTRDSRQLVVLTTDGKLARWNVSGGRGERRLGESLSPTRFSVNVAATRAACVAKDRKSIRLFDLDRGGEIRTFPDVVGTQPGTFALSPDGRQVAMARQDHSVRVCDAATGAELKTLTEAGAGQGGSLAWSPDGKRLAIHGWDSTVRIFDPATGESAGTFAEMGRMPLYLGFSPDSSILVLVTQEARIRVYDRNGVALRTLDDILSGCRQIAFSADGRVMAAADVGGKVRLWDTKTWNRLRDLDTGVARHLAFSPDGRFLAVALVDGSVKLWGGSGPVVSPPKIEVPRPGAPGYLGITGGTEDEGTGALVGAVFDGTPAAKAGLQAGDRITKVGTSDTESFDTLRTVIMSHREGDEIEITYKRGDAEKKVKVKLAARPKDE